MGSAKTDNVARNKLRRKLRKWGMAEEEIRLCVEQVKERQFLKLAGKLAKDAPLCTRAEYVRLMRRNAPKGDTSAPHLHFGDDLEEVDDSKHKPAWVDPVLRGTARAVGETAAAIKRRKTMTKFEYDQRNKT